MVNDIVYQPGQIYSAVLKINIISAVLDIGGVYKNAYPFNGLLANNCLFSDPCTSLECGDFSSTFTSLGEAGKENIFRCL